MSAYWIFSIIFKSSSLFCSIFRASFSKFSWSKPKRCRMPCTRSCMNLFSMPVPDSLPSLYAVSAEITTSPRRCGVMLLKSPSFIGKAITFVGPSLFRYCWFSIAIWGSSTIRMDSSPSGHSKAFKMADAVFFIFSRVILCLFCRLSIRTSIFSFSVFTICRADFIRIFDSVMINSI
jgi:hypothetical protein